MKSRNIAMLGTGFISDFYTNTLHSLRSDDRVILAYSRSKERSTKFAKKWGIPYHSSDLEEAVNHPDINTVVMITQ